MCIQGAAVDEGRCIRRGTDTFLYQKTSSMPHIARANIIVSLGLRSGDLPVRCSHRRSLRLLPLTTLGPRRRHPTGYVRASLGRSCLKNSSSSSSSLRPLPPPPPPPRPRNVATRQAREFLIVGGLYSVTALRKLTRRVTVYTKHQLTLQKR